MDPVRKTQVAAYLRVSSDEQRDNETIRTQEDAILRFVEMTSLEIVDWYKDDGVSGTIPMAMRPDGARLLRDAARGLFQEVLVFKIDRLGRDDLDPIVVWLELERLGVKVRSVIEGVSTIFEYHIRVAMGAEERRSILVRTQAGMDRAAREGRYCGGIVPLGYRAEGHKRTARLVPDDSTFWADWTAVRLVQRIYEWLGMEGRSCRWIAQELNRLGVPTAYQRAGRGLRGQRTQALWRPGRIRNLVVNPIYRGVLAYGRRRSVGSKRIEVIEASVEPIVPSELWRAAQQALLDNRIAPKNTRRSYLLRGVIKCGLCGLAFCGAQGREGVWWYRCNGYMAERGGKDKRCLARSIRNTDIEDLVWLDIEALLRNPGDLIDRLQGEAAHREDSAAAVHEAERVTLDAALVELSGQRQRTLDLFKRGHITGEELEADMAEILQRRQSLEQRLDNLLQASTKEEPSVPLDLFEELRRRLDEGLSDEVRGEVVRALVKRITVYTTVYDPRRKDLRIVIEYRFPRCSSDVTGTDSWLQRA